MLGYADDIMLLSPTLEGLQDMVDTIYHLAPTPILENAKQNVCLS